MNKLVIAAAAFLALSQLAHADPSRDQDAAHQMDGYEQTPKFTPHPVQLWLNDVAPAEMSEHPAVIVRRNAVPANNYAYRFYPHPTGGGFAPPARD